MLSGVDRRQMALFPVSLDEAIDLDNEVRLVFPGTQQKNKINSY